MNTPPQWVTDWMAVYQRQADAKYADDLRVYEQNRTKWVENNIQSRSIGSPITPVPTIPKRKVWTVAPNLMSLVETDVQDPAITDPVLPPEVPVSSAPFRTEANSTQDAMIHMLTGILQMLSEIKAKLG